jgi:hypothetical protein
MNVCHIAIKANCTSCKVHFFESRTVWHHQTMLMVNCYFESEAMQYLKACSDEQVLVL